PSADQRKLDAAQLKGQLRLLEGCWRKFDQAAESASGSTLRKGPRGGGRELEGIVAHVMEADKAYLSKLGGPTKKPADADLAGDLSQFESHFVSTLAPETAWLRKAIVDVLSSRARGEPPPRTPRSGTLWTPRYGIRRAAWHTLDHACETGDRSRS